MPHHLVLEDSTTIKLRVVVDACAKTTTGFSLIDCLLEPKLQDICVIFLYDSVFSKLLFQLMFRKCISKLSWIKPIGTFIGFFGAEGQIETLRMTRVTYGVASSSYHSIRSLQKFANHSEVPSDVERAIMSDLYVDDILTGLNSID